METQGLWYLLDYHKNDLSLRDRTLSKLEREIGNMRHAIDTSSEQKRLDADYIFHGIIISICENRIFGNLYSAMREFMKMEITHAQKNIQNLNEIPLQHKELINSIVDGDFQAATEKFRRHIRNINHLLESKIHHEW